MGVVEEEEKGREVIPGSFTGPGLVDLQVNGYACFDFNSLPWEWSPEDFHRVREALERRGTKAVLPTFITDAPERMIARVRTWRKIVGGDPLLEKAFPKVHLEGPFLSPEKGPRGAHPAEYCRTPRDLPGFLDQALEASGGRIGILTLAPELPGALDLVERAALEGVNVGLGHTAASRDVIRAAVEAGARLCTHLGNGAHPVLPKLDNYIQAQLSEDRLAAGFIADGIHVPLYTLKNFLRAKPAGRAFLVTDATAAADCASGIPKLRGEELLVSKDFRVTRKGKPGLAGSALTLDRAVLNAASGCGLSFREAWDMASRFPAALAGIPLPTEVDVSIGPEGFILQERGEEA